MSLIAEALRAAQRERQGREEELTHRARTLLRPGTLGWSAPLDRVRRRKNPGPLIMAGGLGVALLAALLLSIPPAGPRAAETAPTTKARPDAPPAPPDPNIVPSNPASVPSPAATAQSSSPTPAPGAPTEPAESERLRATSETQRAEGAGRQAASSAGPLRVSTPKGAEGSAFDRWFGQGLALQRSGQYGAALAAYERALALDPEDPSLLNNIGAVRRSLGDLEGAREALRRAIELDPRYAPAWSNLGLVLDALGERQEAALAFQTALRLDPGNPSASVNLAIQYHQAGLLDEAQRLLEGALLRDPLMPEAHYELGRLSESRGEIEKARVHYGRFLELGAARFPEIATRVRARLERLSR